MLVCGESMLIVGFRRCIIVDSTRRGKSMPDALSKTVGIWIVVLNRLLFDDRPDSHDLMTPSEVVSDSEHTQIEERLYRFVEEARGLDLNLDELRGKVKRPMRPYWITPATGLDSLSRTSDDDSFATVVLCTASSKPSVEAKNDPDYVQGAADDHEAWSCGLTAPVFWKNIESLLATAEDDLPTKIAELMNHATSTKDASLSALIKPTTSVFIGDESTIEQGSSTIDVLVYCGPTVDPAIRKRIEVRGGKVIHLPCASGKNGSRQLRASLHNIECLEKIEKAQPKILIAGQEGKDMAVGAALAVVCSFVNESGKLDCLNRQPVTNKAEIKKRLSWIIVSKPDAAPSRATLQSVNSYLMG
jgi:tRNA A64-2'-O-ribosylphosphate transferase